MYLLEYVLLTPCFLWLPQLFFSGHQDTILAETVFGVASVVFAVPDALGRIPLSPQPPAHLCWRCYDTEARRNCLPNVQDLTCRRSWTPCSHCSAKADQPSFRIL